MDMKIRAWDKNKERYVKWGAGFHSETGYDCSPIFQTVDQNEQHLVLNDLFYSNWTDWNLEYEMSTDVFDRNKEEIFENDIIRVRYNIFKMLDVFKR